MNVTNPPLKSPLKWAGSKRHLVPFMEPVWGLHQHRRFVELFCGSCALSLALRPSRVLACDINPHLINFWQWVQTTACVSIPMENDRELYYQYRNQFNSPYTDDSIKAELFLYLNRTGFNGLCRFNKKGEYNVPFGRYKTITYQKTFPLLQQRISEWDFRCENFVGAMDRLVKPDDFIYSDPPFYKTFTQYSVKPFKVEDQINLVSWLSSHPGPVVASNSAKKEMISLYSSYGFDVEIVSAPRHISCNGNRTPAEEILATRNI